MKKSSHLSSVDPVLRAEEIFLLSIHSEVVKFASEVRDFGVSWKDITKPRFFIAAREALAEKGVVTHHPDVPGIALGMILKDGLNDDDIAKTRGPKQAHEEGLYDELSPIYGM